VPLEEECRRLRTELDVRNRRIVEQLEKTQDGPQSSQPSQQAS